MIQPAKDGVPSLRGYEVTRQIAKRLEPHMTNWIACHRYLMAIGPDDHEEVGRMLTLELTTRKRVFILYRLTARFNHARSLAFHAEIAKYVKGAGRSLT